MAVIIKNFETYVSQRTWAFLKESLLFLKEISFSQDNNHVLREKEFFSFYNIIVHGTT
jgi:hypothetical protein